MTYVNTGFGIYEKVRNFSLGFPGLTMFGNFPWWLSVFLFRGCENVKILRIYRFDHYLNMAQVVGVKLDDNIWQRSQQYK